MMKYILVGLGGLVGSLLRLGAGELAAGLAGPRSVPLDAFAVNTLGCFFIGLLAGRDESRGLFSTGARLFLFIGLLGGFTTFSGFSLESFELMRMGRPVAALAGAGAQLSLGFVFVWLGHTLGRLV